MNSKTYREVNRLIQTFPEFGKQLKDFAAICNEEPEACRPLVNFIGKYMDKAVRWYTEVKRLIYGNRTR